jgi:hypothetical protein
MGMRYQLFPKLIYGAAVVTHSPQKLEDAFKSIWYKLLPSLCVNRDITKEYRILLLQFQGLAFQIPALSKKIYLLQSHWETGSTLGRMLHQAYQVFQVEVGLGGNNSPYPLSPLADLPPMGSFIISRNSSIDMESCFIFNLALISRCSGNRTAG